MSTSDKPFFTQAVDAFNAGDRRGAALLLHRELDGGHTPAQFLPQVQRFAIRIGETDLALYAARQAVDTKSLPSMLNYWSLLASFDRGQVALADIAKLPADTLDEPVLLHFRGALAAEQGKTEEAVSLFRRALSKAPGALQTWAALAQLKNFEVGDPDIALMESALQTPGAPPTAKASLLYALGKAYEDTGDNDRAFDFYSQGAAIRRTEGAFDVDAYRAAADRVIADVTASSLQQLKPSTVEGTRSLFVTGMPRSGTTLVQQMLSNHSLVASGAELNLWSLALSPARGSFAKALAYQEQSDDDDPWKPIAFDYSKLVDVHFGHAAPVVDKSLGEAVHYGMLMHIMPDARIAWLRRDPEDVALSCFTTDFTSGLGWTRSLEDIAEMMKVEDRLFAHWKSVFPDRILEVPYAELVADPEGWSKRLQAHFNLPSEDGLADPPREGPAVRTASQVQVRQPVSTGRVGRARKFAKQLKPFRKRYGA